MGKILYKHTARPPAAHHDLQQHQPALEPAEVPSMDTASATGVL